jgi:hypothetical protein
MYAISESSPALCLLAIQQEGVATRRQLMDSGFNQHAIRAQISARRWQPWGFHVVILHNFEPTRRQLMWAAVLDAGFPAALASHTSLELHGFKPFAREAQQLHLLVERGAKVTAHPMVVVHESRRLAPEYHVSVAGLPCTPSPRSAIDAAAWQPWPRFACALVAAVVQQRLCTVDELEQAMQYVGRVRHKAHLREALRDIRGGSEALSEIDLVRVCRRFGIQAPDRQAKRTDRYGRIRYLDAEWELLDGRRVVLEVDGAHHLDVESWQADICRERAVVVGGANVLRATSIELRVAPKQVIDDLLAIGVPRIVRTQLTYNSTGF